MTPIPTVINPAPPTISDVYSSQNIAQATTAPVQAPVSAEQQLYNQFLATPDIQSAKANVSSIQQQINQANQAFRNQKTGFEYQNEGAMGTTGASANLIGRQIGRASDLASNQVSAFSENLRAQQDYLQSLTSDATNRYNIAKGERDQIQDLIRTTKGKANITYTDSFEGALQKAAKYEETELKEAEKKAKKEAEEAKKTAYKDALKAQLKALGSSTKGLSTNELEKKLKKKNKSALEEAKKMSDLEYQLKIKELNKPYYKDEGGGGGGVEEIDKSPSGQAKIMEELIGYGANWNDIKVAFQEDGMEVDSGSYMDDYLKWRYEGGSRPQQKDY